MGDPLHQKPVVPLVDFETIRETLTYIRDDIQRVPGMEKAADRLTAALAMGDHALAGRSIEDVLSSFLQEGPRGHKRNRIQVPLNGASLADPRPGIIQISSPVDTHNISSRFPHER